MKVFNFDPRQDSTRNYAINGNFDFWQRGTSVTRTQVTGGGRLADRFYTGAAGATAKSITIARSTSVPTGLTYAASYSHELTNNTITTSFTGVDGIEACSTNLEGLFIQPLAGGLATLGFWLESSFAGTVTVAFRNLNSTLSYVTAIAVATGWNYYTVTVNLSAITIPNTTASGLNIVIGALYSPTYQAPVLNAWSAGNYLSHSSATNWAATTGLKFRVAQIQLRKGAVSAEDMKNSFSLFAGSYDNELRACQRYYEKSYNLDVALGSITPNGAFVGVTYGDGVGLHDSKVDMKVTKRVAPVIGIWTVAAGLVSGADVRSSVYNGSATTTLLVGGVSSFTVRSNAYAPNAIAGTTFHWAADAEF